MNKTLSEVWNTHNKRYTLKLAHYLDIYEGFISKYIGKPVILLEFGVFHGGSLQIWREYFGEQSQIFGVDINEKSRYSEEGIKTFIGDETNNKFLEEIKKAVPTPDIFIDNASHNAVHQLNLFKNMYPFIKEGGLYILEDILCQGNPHAVFQEVARIAVEMSPWPQTEIISPTFAIHIFHNMIIVEKKVVDYTTIMKGNRAF